MYQIPAMPLYLYLYAQFKQLGPQQLLLLYSLAFHKVSLPSLMQHLYCIFFLVIIIRCVIIRCAL